MASVVVMPYDVGVMGRAGVMIPSTDDDDAEEEEVMVEEDG